MGNTKVVGSDGNLGGGSSMGNPGNMGNLGNPGNLGNLGNLAGSSEGTESRQNYWAPSFGNWPTHTVSKSEIYLCVIGVEQNFVFWQELPEFSLFGILVALVPFARSNLWIK